MRTKNKVTMKIPTKRIFSQKNAKNKVINQINNTHFPGKNSQKKQILLPIKITISRTKISPRKFGNIYSNFLMQQNYAVYRIFVIDKLICRCKKGNIFLSSHKKFQGAS